VKHVFVAPTKIGVTRRDEGQALVEYALVLLLIALVTVAALTSIGVSVSSALFDMANGL
jgi:Flp pilus assembly pilin Flp